MINYSFIRLNFLLFPLSNSRKEIRVWTDILNFQDCFTFALVDGNSDASRLDHEKQVAFSSLANDTATIFIRFFVEAIANSSQFRFWELKQILLVPEKHF